MDELMEHKLDDLAKDVTEIKADVKSIKDASPIHRISSLESWRKSVNAFLAAIAVAAIGAWVTVLLTR